MRDHPAATILVCCQDHRHGLGTVLASWQCARPEGAWRSSLPDGIPPLRGPSAFSSHSREKPGLPRSAPGEPPRCSRLATSKSCSRDEGQQMDPGSSTHPVAVTPPRLPDSGSGHVWGVGLPSLQCPGENTFPEHSSFIFQKSQASLSLVSVWTPWEWSHVSCVESVSRMFRWIVKPTF